MLEREKTYTKTIICLDPYSRLLLYAYELHIGVIVYRLIYKGLLDFIFSTILYAVGQIATFFSVKLDISRNFL